MDEKDLSHVQDETDIVPGILNVLLINGKQGKLKNFALMCRQHCQANLLNNSPNDAPIDLAQHLIT